MKKQVQTNLNAVKAKVEEISKKELQALKGGSETGIVTEDLIDV